jgi:hypothetical protein
MANLSEDDPLSGLILNIYIGGTAEQRSEMAPALAASEPDSETSLMTKKEANYRHSELNEDEYPEECSTCNHYSTTGGGLGSCYKVAGTINPEWVCDYYDKGQS